MILKRQLSEQRLPGTGDWLFRRREYLEWVDSRLSPCLWISGSAGTGKSSLAASIIDQVYQKHHRPVFFFFNAWRQVDDDPEVSILRSIADQLGQSWRQPLIPKSCHSRLCNARNATHMPIDTFREHLRFMLELLEPSKRFFFIIDGLNEVAINSAICKEIIYAKKLQDKLRFCQCAIISRRKSPGDTFLNSINLDDEIGLRLDIRHFITTKLEANTRSKTNERRRLASVKDTLFLGAKGMFLWAEVALKQLAVAQSAPDLMLRVQSLPITISGLYQQLLQEMSGKHDDFAQSVFSWLVVCYRPLKLSEIKEAIELTSLESSDHSPTVQQLSKDVFSRNLGYLVHISEDETCTFIHPSVRDFLVSLSGPQDAYLPLTKAHDSVARSCLILLRSSANSDRSFSQVAPRNQGLLEYAEKYWSYHLLGAEAQGNPISGELQSALVSAWSELCIRNQELKAKGVADMLFSLGVFHGLPSLLRISLSLGKSPNGLLIHDCYSPLFSIDSYDHRNILAFSLGDELYQPTARSSVCKSPLRWATLRGHYETARILLQSGCQVDLEGDHDGMTPLHCAVVSGYHAIVRLLLQNGANVNARTRETGETALHLAAKTGKILCVKYLIDSRNHSESQVRMYEAIIQQPYFESWSEDLLTDFDGHGHRVWDIDSRSLAESDMQILVSEPYGCPDINAVDIYGHTALHLAVSGGHEKVTKFLIENGADCQAKNCTGHTALHLAIESGQMSTFKRLIAHGSMSHEPINEIIGMLDLEGHKAMLDLLLWERFMTEVTGAKCPLSAMELATKSEISIIELTVRKARAKRLSLSNLPLNLPFRTRMA